MMSDAAITIRLNHGFSQSDIAREFNVSRQAVSFRLKYKEKMKHPIPAVRRFTVVFLRRLGFTLNEISDLVGYTETHIRQILKINGMPSSDMKYCHKVQKVSKNIESFCTLFLFRIGFTIPEIAIMTEYNVFAIYKYIIGYGYSAKGRC